MIDSISVEFTKWLQSWDHPFSSGFALICFVLLSKQIGDLGRELRITREMLHEVKRDLDMVHGFRETRQSLAERDRYDWQNYISKKESK